MKTYRGFPKIIHQSHKSLEHLSSEDLKRVAKLKNLNPDWEWKFWTDEDNRNLIKEKYSWFLSTYDSYEFPIQRADAVRYFYMFEYGGIYLDLDMDALKPIESLISKALDLELEAIFGTPVPSTLLFDEYLNNYLAEKKIYNAILISKPHTEFWLLVHSLLKSRMSDYKYHTLPKEEKVFWSTGPSLLGEAFKIYSSYSAYVGLYPFYYTNIDGVLFEGKYYPQTWKNSKFLDNLVEKGGVRRTPPEKIAESFVNDSPFHFVHRSQKIWKEAL